MIFVANDLKHWNRQATRFLYRLTYLKSTSFLSGSDFTYTQGRTLRRCVDVTILPFSLMVNSPRRQRRYIHPASESESNNLCVVRVQGNLFKVRLHPFQRISMASYLSMEG